LKGNTFDNTSAFSSPPHEAPPVQLKPRLVAQQPPVPHGTLQALLQQRPPLILVQSAFVEQVALTEARAKQLTTAKNAKVLVV
jgi:hypothetical protein